MKAPRRRGPRIHVLLLGVQALVIAAPFFVVAALRIYDTWLVRQTERQLIAQAVVIGEAFREAWLVELGQPIDPGGEVPSFRPPRREADAFIPVEPVTDLMYGVQPPQPEVMRRAEVSDTAERRAGRRIEPLLRRTQVFNLGAARVLDAEGCVVATSRGEDGLCLDALPEVRQALAGTYAAVARARISDEPLPPISDVRSRGSVRIFVALPVFSDGRVIAVVRMSRTSLDALTSLWHSRRALVIAGAASLSVVVLASMLFAGLIARPVRALTRRARAIADGTPGPAPPLPSSLFTPEELRTLGDALDTMATQLRARAAYVAELAANASHELKAPITSIRGAAELLRDEWRGMDEAQRSRFLENIDADARRMERLVARLLELARIENAQAKVERVELADFLDAIGRRYGDEVEIVRRDPPASLQIDPDHLASAVRNLVDNAVRHGRGQRVTVLAGRDGARLRIDVIDRGPGISEANQRRLFERFFTTERDAGGTGLGLAITRAVAEGRGGEMRFVTGPGGTTFTVVL